MKREKRRKCKRDEYKDWRKRALDERWVNHRHTEFEVTVGYLSRNVH